MIAPLLEKYTLYDKTKDIEEVPRKLNKSDINNEACDIEVNPPCPIHNKQSPLIEVSSY